MLEEEEEKNRHRRKIQVGKEEEKRQWKKTDPDGDKLFEEDDPGQHINKAVIGRIQRRHIRWIQPCQCLEEA